MPPQHHQFWTNKENNLLIKYYLEMKIREVASILGRSFYSVHHHAKELGLVGIKHSLSGWNREDVKVLVDNYQTMTCRQMGNHLGRSCAAIADMARKLGLKKPRGWWKGKPGPHKGKLKTWTEEEIQLLGRIYSTQSNKEIAELLPRHSEEAIGSKARALGMHKSPDFIKENSTQYVGRGRLQRDINAINRRPTKELLIHLYSEDGLTVREIARHLAVCNHTVRAWFTYYGIPLISKSRSIIRGLEIAYKKGWRPKCPIITGRPTPCEQKLIDIVSKQRLPLRYTGDGSFRIESIYPDFVECNGKKICVEVFGDYWHTPLFNPRVRFSATESERKRILKKYGWKCIILWESALMTPDGEEYALKILGKEGIK